jgi:GxxExxY protein
VQLELEDLARKAVDCGYKLHREIGPGLLESVYEVLMAEILREAGLSVERQVIIPIKYKGIVIDNAFRADIIVKQKLLLELKSTELMVPVHGKQVLTYLRLMDLPLGLLMNFGQETYRDGVRRIANRYFAPHER